MESDTGRVGPSTRPVVFAAAPRWVRLSYFANPSSKRHVRPRSALHQHGPYALHGRGPEGELGTPRDADGPGAACLRAVHQAHEARPRRSALAGSRSLRALVR